MHKNTKIAIGVGTLLFCLGGAIGTANATGDTTPLSNSDTTVSAPADPTPAPVEEAPEPDMTMSQEQAVRSAESYLDLGIGFSEEGLTDQLEYEGFSDADIAYAIDYVDPDWNEQAAMSAEGYLQLDMGWSAASLTDQLEYEGFTDAQIEYALDAVGY